MAFGALDLFYKGLEGIIGPPQMVHGNLRTAMEFDHCQAADSHIKFNASNGLTSTSAAGGDRGCPSFDKSYPERRAFRTPTSCSPTSAAAQSLGDGGARGRRNERPRRAGTQS